MIRSQSTGLFTGLRSFPSARGMPYGQTGRRATVYQLVTQDGTFNALKLFVQAYRSPRLAEQVSRVSPYALLPGLLVCNYRVLTPDKHAAQLVQQPDLSYSVLMPWIAGETWEEVVLSGRELPAETSRRVAEALLATLATMERRGIAHCDVSGPNVILSLSSIALSLVDVEDL